MFAGQRILITGGTGSWGRELARQLLDRSPEEIIVYSRNESGQVAMDRELRDSRVSYRIGDVRDRKALTQACKGVDLIFHLAALKHVPVCENHPYEALKTNVLGTQNVIEAALENGVKKVVNVSSDKAASPSGFYGMTKAIGEKLIVYANLLDGNTKFISVRGGNVLGTAGSVLSLFMNQIAKGEPIGITHPAMTRFFLTLADTVRFLIGAASEGEGGEIYVMKAPACRIADLAEVLMEEAGKRVDVVETGVRPGEKLHETLLTEQESATAIAYDDRYLILLPTIDIPGLKPRYSGFAGIGSGGIRSDRPTIGKADIRRLLERGGLLSRPG
ncbi:MULTISPECIES: SDR family NAD(P)-dependent oxidoreductase [Cohnella]|uniref:SDR family NAD(P)-dependent oxidoreductase n=1 Tax=Cohnella TaxID=329857 RepID=UPI0009BBA9C0|nr:MULTISPECIES: SDR family NAD(P)-dependent oxidoreductase [Cohnella]MBN2982937.1 SDR family NAD(P)-dependent oxidoreductase [Cohnella algarum]